jgi:hypothetical protein
MNIEEIGKAMGNFKIERLCDTILGYNPHDALIGEWLRWWLSDSVLEAARAMRLRADCQ